MSMPQQDEPVDERFKIRFSVGDSRKSAISHGHAIKFVLIDKENLLLYQNILELNYSISKRAVREKSSSVTSVRGKKGWTTKIDWDEKTMRLLSENFVKESCKVIGEAYRPKLRKAVNRLVLNVEKLFPLQNS